MFKILVVDDDKNTYDLLQRKRIPISSGFSTIWVNDGSIRNRGLEVSFDATPVARGDFEWNISGNISFNRNEITSIGKDTGDYFLGSNVGNGDYFNAPANIFREGCPVGLFYGYRTNGIVPVGQTGIPLTEGGEPRGPGSISYVDMDGNGYLSLDDRTVIGDPNPDFTYGFSTSLSWKGLSLSVACDGSYGNDIVNANLLQETDISRVRMCSGMPGLKIIKAVSIRQSGLFLRMRSNICQTGLWGMVPISGFPMCHFHIRYLFRRIRWSEVCLWELLQEIVMSSRNIRDGILK